MWLGASVKSNPLAFDLSVPTLANVAVAPRARRQRVGARLVSAPFRRRDTSIDAIERVCVSVRVLFSKQPDARSRETHRELCLGRSA